MKNIAIICISLISFCAFAQSNIVDVTIDGKPARMNITTGDFTFTNGTPGNSNANNSFLNNTNSNIHVVNSGETLYSLSKQYGVSVSQIKTLNNLTSNAIIVNQELKLSSVATSGSNFGGSVYVVEKGDTLYSISRKTNLSVQELKQQNNLQSNIIIIGQELSVK